MDYSPDAFSALWESIEQQSGARSPDRCTSEDVIFSVPPYTKPHTIKSQRDKLLRGCGHESIFVCVYDARSKPASGEGYVRVCAVCDNVGAWPVHQKAVLEADPDMIHQLRIFEEEDEE